ncbi:MAG: CHAD domain-containing protein [Thermoplasmata archaeon]|nr:CHAD domain-containing protein [Thermoplasmata archaeon]
MARPRSPPRAVAEFVGELERRLDATLHELDRLVAAPRPAASALHRLHRDLRRLRVGVSVWARLLSKSPRSELKGFDRRLKRLARLVGGVRDRDVALGLLADRSLPGGTRERVRLVQVRRRLVDDARVGRELLRVFLRAERDAGLFEGIRAGLHENPPRNRVQHLEGYLSEIRDEGRREVQQAHRRARRNPSTRRLHSLRIRMRNWRHLADLSTTLTPASSPPPPSPPLRALQRRLGRLHDLEVAENLARPARGTRWARSLEEEQQRQRHRIVQQLRSHRSREVVPLAEAAA